MRALRGMLWLAAMLSVAAAAGAQELKKFEPATVADILSPAQLSIIAARRAAGAVPPGISYTFTFKDVPSYGAVEAHYLIEEVREGDRTVRRLAEHPSAVVYVLQAKRYSEMRAHLREAEFADVLEQLLAIEKDGDSVRGVKIRRALFDPGEAGADAFLRNRREYYDSARGTPLFERWPEELRRPCGRFTDSVVYTEIWRSSDKTPQVKTLYAKQFFGYLFPVLDEILSAEEKAEAADQLRRSNVRDGAARITLDDVGEYGAVTIYYLIRENKPLAHPTAMVSRVTLVARQIADDPMLPRKYLAPEGANHLMSEIRAGEKAGQKLQSVEITRVQLDVTARGTPAGDAAHAEFRRNITTYCRQDFLIRPETWPDKFRSPDGKFDVELTTTSIAWKVLKRD